MLGQSLERPRDLEGGGVAERAAIAARLQPQRIRIGNAVAAVELEGHRVEGAPVVCRTATMAARGRREPVGELVQQR